MGTGAPEFNVWSSLRFSSLLRLAGRQYILISNAKFGEDAVDQTTNPKF